MRQSVRNLLLVVVGVLAAAYAGSRMMHKEPSPTRAPIPLVKKKVSPDLPMQHGKVEKVGGEAVGIDESLMFAVADVTLEGNGWGFASRFDEDNKADDMPGSLKSLVKEKADSVWVRGRIEYLFEFRNKIEKERTEKTFSEVGMVAVIKDGETQYLLPFICTDHYGRTGLMFSEPRPDPSLISRVSQGLWRVLLSNPDQLHEYSDTMYHLGAGVNIDYGIKAGQAWIRERR